MSNKIKITQSSDPSTNPQYVKSTKALYSKAFINDPPMIYMMNHIPKAARISNAFPRIFDLALAAAELNHAIWIEATCLPDSPPNDSIPPSFHAAAVILPPGESPTMSVMSIKPTRLLRMIADGFLTSLWALGPLKVTKKGDEYPVCAA